jgi:hypothetical protein
VCGAFFSTSKASKLSTCRPLPPAEGMGATTPVPPLTRQQAWLLGRQGCRGVQTDLNSAFNSALILLILPLMLMLPMLLIYFYSL